MLRLAAEPDPALLLQRVPGHRPVLRKQVARVLDGSEKWRLIAETWACCGRGNFFDLEQDEWKLGGSHEAYPPFTEV